ncbi:MAG: hypothetical protein EXR81_00735 [Gammaproteobacteria bacterium]|nr:hypothetical protein [Gammaproteobacteria bacterium]
MYLGSAPAEEWTKIKAKIISLLSLPAPTKAPVKRQMILELYREHRIFLSNIPVAFQAEAHALLKAQNEFGRIKISSLLSGLIEPIEDAAIRYFREYFARLGRIITNIEITPKKSGQQLGTVLWITYTDPTDPHYSPPKRIGYHIKTHQHGPAYNDGGRTIVRESETPVDLKELLVYAFLANMGIGPKSHFLLSPVKIKGACYIATQTAAFTKTPAAKEKTFVIYEHFQRAQAGRPIENKVDQHGLFRVQLLLWILQLHDLTTNTGNFGKISTRVKEQLNEQWEIIDFRVATRDDQDYRNPRGILEGLRTGGPLLGSELMLQGLFAGAPTLNERMQITAKILTEFKTGKPRQSGEEGFKTPFEPALYQAFCDIIKFATEHAEDLVLDQVKLLGIFAGNTALTPKDIQIKLMSLSLDDPTHRVQLGDLGCYVTSVLTNLHCLSLHCVSFGIGGFKHKV